MPNPYDQFDANPYDQFDEEPRSLGQEVGRQAGLAGRYLAEGALSLPALVANVPALLADKALEAAGSDFRFGDQNAAVSGLLSAAGLPQPETDTERVVGVASRGMAGGGSLPAVASRFAGPVAQTLTAGPLAQTLGGATGAVSSDKARENGAGYGGQLLAGMAGGAAPAVIGSVAPAATRLAFRGGEAGRQRVSDNLGAFNRVGTTPTVGQATESRAMRGAESLLSRTPGGAAPVIRAAEQQADDMGAELVRRAERLSSRSTPEKAGRAIQEGIEGRGGFLESAKAKRAELYSEVDSAIDPGSRVTVDNTRRALAGLNQKIPGAPNVSNNFVNARIRGLEGDLRQDTQGLASLLDRPDVSDEIKEAARAILAGGDPPPDAGNAALMIGSGAAPPRVARSTAEGMVDGRLPYQALAKLRTLVGQELDDAGLASSVPRNKWKTLYGALSQDLETAARQAGPAAYAKWRRANNYYAASSKRMDDIAFVLDKNGGPEKVFAAATSGTKDGATVLRQVMRSLPKDGQRAVSAAVLRKLGKARPGQQDADGAAFSAESFLTEWNKISPEAKAVLFDRLGSGFRKDMDDVAKVAANLREGSGVFRNPSGTGQAAIQYTTIGGFMMALLTGNFGAAGTVAAGAAGANLASRLMVNPKFVKWLASSSRAPRGAEGALIAQLARIGADDPEVAAVAEYLNDQRNKADK